MAAPGPPSRWRLRSWAKPAVGDGYPDHDHAQPGPVADSTSDTRGWERSMPASRSVVSVLVRELGNVSLHPQDRPRPADPQRADSVDPGDGHDRDACARQHPEKQPP